jgi:hypothetical protein
LEQSLRSVVREIERRLKALPDHSHAVRLMTAAFILTGLRIPKTTLSSIYEGVTIMHKTVAYDEVMDAVQAAENRVRHEFLLRLGQKRFGEPNARIKAALTAIRSPNRLERMHEAVLTVDSWKELLIVK